MLLYALNEPGDWVTVEAVENSHGVAVRTLYYDWFAYNAFARVQNTIAGKHQTP